MPNAVRCISQKPCKLLVERVGRVCSEAMRHRPLSKFSLVDFTIRQDNDRLMSRIGFDAVEGGCHRCTLTFQDLKEADTVRVQKPCDTRSIVIPA